MNALWLGITCCIIRTAPLISLLAFRTLEQVSHLAARKLHPALMNNLNRKPYLELVIVISAVQMFAPRISSFIYGLLICPFWGDLCDTGPRWNFPPEELPIVSNELFSASCDSVHPFMLPFASAHTHLCSSDHSSASPHRRHRVFGCSVSCEQTSARTSCQLSFT